MSLVATRRLLWLVALLTVPVPVWLFESARVPVVWMAQLSGYGVALWLSETPSLSVRVLAGATILQTLGWAGILYLGARLVAGRLVPHDWRSFGVAVVVAALVLGALLPIYRTTLIRDGVPVSWIGLFT